MKPLSKEKIEAYLKNDTRCPWCGSRDISAEQFESNIASTWQPINCNNCGAEWEDQYKLVGIAYKANSGKEIYTND